jgi:hypothetical protein
VCSYLIFVGGVGVVCEEEVEIFHAVVVLMVCPGGSLVTGAALENRRYKELDSEGGKTTLRSGLS